ncbi:hypothetical protein ACS0TY_007077 [Phlomoides rotata]
MLTSSRDNWERLVAAVVKRQQIWELCHQQSRTPSICSSITSDDFSEQNLSDFDPFSLPPSPLLPSKYSSNQDGAAVTFLLEQVTEVIRGYADLISSADKEFKKLKEDVEVLKAILKDTSSTSTMNKGARLIKNQIRDVVYEVEDAIDTWLTESKAKHRLMRGAAGLTFAKKVKTLREGQVKEMLHKANEMRIALKYAGTTKEAEVLERRKEVMIWIAHQVMLKHLEPPSVYDRVDNFLLRGNGTI